MERFFYVTFFAVVFLFLFWEALFPVCVENQHLREKKHKKCNVYGPCCSCKTLEGLILRIANLLRKYWPNVWKDSTHTLLRSAGFAEFDVATHYVLLHIGVDPWNVSEQLPRPSWLNLCLLWDLEIDSFPCLFSVPPSHVLNEERDYQHTPPLLPDVAIKICAGWGIRNTAPNPR